MYQISTEANVYCGKGNSEAFPFWNTISGENSAFLNIKSTYYTIEVKQMEQIAYIKGAKKGTMSFGYVSTEKVQTASKD